MLMKLRGKRRDTSRRRHDVIHIRIIGHIGSHFAEVQGADRLRVMTGGGGHTADNGGAGVATQGFLQYSSELRVSVRHVHVLAPRHAGQPCDDRA